MARLSSKTLLQAAAEDFLSIFLPTSSKPSLWARASLRDSHVPNHLRPQLGYIRSYSRGSDSSAGAFACSGNSLHVKLLVCADGEQLQLLEVSRGTCPLPQPWDWSWGEPRSLDAPEMLTKRFSSDASDSPCCPEEVWGGRGWKWLL